MWIFKIVLLFFLLPIKLSVSADNMSFYGTIMDTVPCEINNGETISVNFGNIGINKIDGIRYKEKVSFQLKCPGGFDIPFRLIYRGEVSDFDPAAVKTSTNGLGIKLFRACSQSENCEVKIGESMDIDMKGSEMNSQQFHVVPVKKQNIDIKDGYFQSSASFHLDYY
ncbi:TPA: fimbrial protein [Providencia alcalifaciens]